MKDTYNKPISGHIIIECLDKSGAVIDRFEKNNLIMDNARNAMTKLAAKITGSAPINKFVIGTSGHITGNYLTPKTEVQGFVSSRTRLFSEEVPSYTYPIVFTNPGSVSGNCAIVSEPDSGTVISLLTTTNSIQYTIEIDSAAANNTGIVVFTEAALYAGSDIFSMKCFPGKIKDNTVSLRIIWKILL